MGAGMSEAPKNPFAEMMAQAQDMAQAFNPALRSFDPKEMEALWPTLSRDAMEMWFGKTMNRDGLDAKTRLMVSLAALVALGAQAEPQIRLTVRHLLEAGATQREITEVIWQMSMFGGVPAMHKALEIAQGVFDETKE